MKHWKLVDFIREKVAKGNFPYREGAWEHAAGQFAQWDAARRRRRRILLLLIPFFMGTAIILWQSMQIAQSYKKPASLSAFPEVTEAIVQNQVSKDAFKADTHFSNRSQSEKNTSISKAVQFAPDIISDSSMNKAALTEQQKTIEVLSEEINEFAPPSISLSQQVEKKNLTGSSFQLEYVLPDSRILPLQRRVNELPFKRLSPYIELGYAFFKGFSNENVPDPRWGASPLAGFGLVYRLNRLWRLKAGLQYAGRTEINHSLANTALSFDFVRRESNIKWEPSQLLYLGLPLEAQYRVFRNHRILLGGQISCLLGTKGVISEQRSSFYEPAGAPEISDAPSYVTGISLWDAQVRLGYELPLNRRAGLVISYQRGLIDLLDNNRFGHEGMNRNTSFSLLMNYHF